MFETRLIQTCLLQSGPGANLSLNTSHARELTAWGKTVLTLTLVLNATCRDGSRMPNVTVEH